MTIVVEITPLTRQINRYISELRIMWRRFYRVSRGTIFAPFNFDYESSRVTRVSTPRRWFKGGENLSAFAAGIFAHVQRLKTYGRVIFSIRFFTLLLSHFYIFIIPILLLFSPEKERFNFTRYVHLIPQISRIFINRSEEYVFLSWSIPKILYYILRCDIHSNVF